MMMQRTCYSIAPYGETNTPATLGPSKYMMQEGYIFVYQDVRGRYKSEGTWTNMTPVIDNKKSKKMLMKVLILTIPLTGWLKT
jgi:predicted acyl esterase